MKKSLVISAVLAATVGAYAQGTVQFNNVVTASGLRAQIYGPESDPTISRSGNTAAGLPIGAQTYGGALLAGTGFTAQLWGSVGAGVSEGSLAPLATTTFRTGSAAGVVTSQTVAVPGALIDGTGYRGTFQLRVWDNQGGTVTSWAMVLAGPNVLRGLSGIFSPAGSLGGTDTPAATAPVLAGLTSFNLFTPVPEPSVIALGALGLGALLLRRRKQA